MSDIFWVTLTCILGIAAIGGTLLFFFLAAMMVAEDVRNEHENTYR